MLEFPGGRGIGGIRGLGKYVGKVCGKRGSCVGKYGDVAMEKNKMGAEVLIGCLARLCESFLKVEKGCDIIFSGIL